jgi:diacylglycerol kinase
MLNIRKTLRSFKFAFDGILYLFKNENNARAHLLAAVVVVGLGIWLKISSTEWCFVVLAIGLVSAAEAFNSAIEKLCDMIEPNQHPQIKIIKDVAAGAVLLTALAAAGVGIVVFGAKVLGFFLV